MRRLLVLVAVIVVACSDPTAAAPRRTLVTLYMQNETRDEVWVAAWPPSGLLSTAFPRGTGVRCYRIETGRQLVLLDGAPAADGDPAVKSVIVETHGEHRDNNSRIAWAAVSPTGEATSGEGVPAWWPESPHDCTLGPPEGS